MTTYPALHPGSPRALRSEALVLERVASRIDACRPLAVLSHGAGWGSALLVRANRLRREAARMRAVARVRGARS